MVKVGRPRKRTAESVVKTSEDKPEESSILKGESERYRTFKSEVYNLF